MRIELVDVTKRLAYAAVTQSPRVQDRDVLDRVPKTRGLSESDERGRGKK